MFEMPDLPEDQLAPGAPDLDLPEPVIEEQMASPPPGQDEAALPADGMASDINAAGMFMTSIVDAALLVAHTADCCREVDVLSSLLFGLTAHL